MIRRKCNSPSARASRATLAWIALFSAAYSPLATSAGEFPPQAPDGVSGKTNGPVVIRNSFFDRLAAGLSPRMRALTAERDAVAGQLAATARPNNAPTSDAVGFHSQLSRSARSTKWVQVDLGQPQAIETIALVPAFIAVGEYSGPGYGFPRRFKVETANEPTFDTPRLVADFSAEDFSNPGNYPVIAEASGKKARYIRVTATKLWQRGDYAVFALGELLALSGERNLAAGAKVTASDSTETLPQWSPRNLVDGQSVLGLPVDEVPSPSNGYHSMEHETRRNATKWVQVDLGRDIAIDEVRLIPARPRDWALISGFGFPIRFRVEAFSEPESTRATLLRAEDPEDLQNPGENAMVIPCPATLARFVRVTATRLWSRGDYYAFALAELQVFSGGTNVALGSAVTALDSVEQGFWSTKALVDGYSSQRRLVDFSSWLRSLGRGAELTARWRRLDEEQTQLTSAVLRRATRGSLVIGAIFLLGFGLLGYRYRLLRLLEVERLRTRIATDLHDELGTRLTRIGLLSDLVGRQADDSEATKAKASQITAMTRDVVRTMDEIVWAMNPRNDTVEELANYLVHFTEEFFRDTSVRCRLNVPASLPPLRLATEVRHNLFLAVKEALNNLMKHSQARNAQVTLAVDPPFLTISVQDDGQGIAAERPAGNGLRNIRERMQSIGGTAEIHSETGQGAQVRLRTQLAPARKRGLFVWGQGK